MQEAVHRHIIILLHDCIALGLGYYFMVRFLGLHHGWEAGLNSFLLVLFIRFAVPLKPSSTNADKKQKLMEILTRSLKDEKYLFDKLK